MQPEPRSNTGMVNAVLDNLSPTGLAKYLGCAPGDLEVVRMTGETTLIRQGGLHNGAVYFEVTVRKVSR